MTRRNHTKLVREGPYVAQVDVELINGEEGWAPYLSLEKAQKLDDLRLALRHGDLDCSGQRQVQHQSHSNE